MNPKNCTCALLFVLVICGNSLGQGSADDYRRANSIRTRANQKRGVGRLEPNWLNNNQFWYLWNSWTDNSALFLVNGENAKQIKILEQSALSKLLSDATGEEVSRKDAAINVIQFKPDTNKVVLNAINKSWDYVFETKDNEVVRASLIATVPNSNKDPNSEKTTGVEVLNRFERSNSSRDETSVSFINKRNDEIEIFWIDSTGRRQSFGKIEAGKTHKQHTFASHVWLVSDNQSQPLTLVRATRQAGQIIIDEDTKSEIQFGNRRQSRGSRGSMRSPNGNFTASIRNHNLWIKDQSDDSELQMTTDGSEDDPFRSRFYWSPDSNFLVVLQETNPPRRKVTIVESSPRDQVQPKLVTYDYYKPGDVIPVARPRLFDLKRKTQIPVEEDLFSNAYQIRNIRWEPDSSRFTFLFNQRGHQVVRLLSVNSSNGVVKTIASETSETFVDYQGKLYSQFVDATNELIWMSERDGWNHLYLIDSLSGDVKNQITKGEWVVRGVESVDEENRQIWFRASGIYPEQDPYLIHHCRIDFDGSNLIVLTTGNGTHDIQFSPDKTFLIDSFTKVDQPPVHELRLVESGSLVTPIVSTKWEEASILPEMAKPSPFVAKGRDGVTDIWGVIFRPSNFDPKKKYPVIENIYAGPHSSHVPKSFSNNHRSQSMAELGFIVVQIDGMGTSNRSKAFHDVCWRNLADSGFPDRILWMKAAAKAYPEMDISNVGIYGGSAGGQSTVAGLLQFGDFYKVGVADCGCHDNRMDKIWWNELWMGWPVGPHYAANSNVTMAKKLTGKLLLIVGELDRNVDPASTMQVVDALVKADKDFEMLVIPGAGHGAAGTPYGRRRMQDFLVRNILKVEPRWQGSANE